MSDVREASKTARTTVRWASAAKLTSALVATAAAVVTGRQVSTSGAGLVPWLIGVIAVLAVVLAGCAVKISFDARAKARLVRQLAASAEEARARPGQWVTVTAELSLSRRGHRR